MPIKTHTDLRKAARPAITLFEQFHWKEEEYSIYTDTLTQWTKVQSAWRNFCRALDRVVYAAGGHREGCTWHLIGTEITAATLWNSDSQVTHLVEDFLFSQDDRSTAHAKMRIAAFWANRVAPLPKAQDRKGLVLPAAYGDVLQSVINERARAEQDRLREMYKAIDGVREMDPSPDRDRARKQVESAYNVRFSV
jgi:hypothetical protein